MITDCAISMMHEFEKYISIHTNELIGLILIFFLISVLSGEEVNARFLVLYLLVMAYMTFFNRTGGSRRVSLRPFATYRYFFTNDYFRQQILNNILLFVPLGIILSQIRPCWSTFCCLPYISLGIEIMQFVTARGLFEADDLIGNSLGGLIGFTAGMLWVLAVRLIHRLQMYVDKKKDLKSKDQ